MLRHLFAHDSIIRLVRVDLGSRSVSVPVADMMGQRPGPTLLVTAGMDGDEYAGMEAAYALIREYASGNFAGRLIIIPILNIPGFEANVSLNPLDDAYPKAIFPGSAKGSASERLIHWLYETYGTQANAWIDLHGGSLAEKVFPFVWTFETGVDEADAFIRQVHARVDSETTVFEKAGRFSKAGQLARLGCPYIMTESGGRGERLPKDVDRHVRWVQQLMGLLAMDPPRHPRECGDPSGEEQRIIRKFSYIFAPFDGIWRPEAFTRSLIEDQLIGYASKVDGEDVRKIRTDSSGTVLWFKETMQMKRGELLMAIGRV